MGEERSRNEKSSLGEGGWERKIEEEIDSIAELGKLEERRLGQRFDRQKSVNAQGPKFVLLVF